jgi:DNA primase
MAAMQALAARQSNDPMDSVGDPDQRALLAEALLQETEPPPEPVVHNAVASLAERHIISQIRSLREAISQAEQQGDFVALAQLTQQKLKLDRELRKLQNG